MRSFFRTTYRWAVRGMKLTVFGTIIGIVGIIGVLIYAITQGPPSLMTEQNTVFYGTDGEIIGEEQGAEERYWINIEEMPESIKDATLAIEDRRFYNHFGFDLKRIAAAALTDIKQMRMAEGASTITQQYARNLYLSHDKTWKRKLNEALYALRLEIFYNKDEILEGYLNTIYYGHGAYGIEAASRQYFNKHAADLTLTEASMLAGIPKGPTYYSPLANAERAEARQQQILAEMERNGYITSSEKRAAVEASISYADGEEDETQEIAPYFQDQVVTEAAQLLDVDRESVQTGGYHIHTTLIEEHQRILEEQVKRTIPGSAEIQTASAVMDSHSGAITALVGGKDYGESPFNRATQAKRSVGSTIKPFLYYAALAEGYSPVTMKETQPIEIEVKGKSEPYIPSNFNDQYAEEPISMAQALAVSDNIYAVKTHMDIGPEKLGKTMKTFGVEETFKPHPSLALGYSSISLFDMVSAYGKMVKGTESIEGHTIAKITDRHGNVLYEYKPTYNKDDAVDRVRAFTVTHMMTGMFDPVLDADYASVTGTPIKGKLTRMYGGKSGTTDNDSWMIGFSPQYVSAVWVGYDEGSKPLEGFNDHRYAKAIWADTMEKIHENEPTAAFIPPPGVKGVYIDPETGYVAGPNCPQERLVYMEESDIPKDVCGGDESKDVDDEFKDDPWFKDVVDWFF
ncbi:transglycosylase domain-containing protein [Halobacillus sp. Nhm2S1]|uniref:transglycosylase domain-containing protein n=1 Tax=Halobacillus sp. Nhm2S1 TaxID=2866716 RepID=UPI001C73CFB8|nr:PBP1A family penicillin-binding protein [Halobacillus sp. Nhm2S1]MBX0357911.1 PBP1A family penicillin-binding protein [Halobacillus sp. Nhm2S1]